MSSTSHHDSTAPLGQTSRWRFGLPRALLLGTADEGSPLRRLRNEHEMLGMILGLVEPHWESEVLGAFQPVLA